MADMLAVPLDLAAWRKTTIAEDDDTARIALETATGLVQAEMRQRIVAVANETVTLRGGRPSLWLPESPVTAVGAVTTTDKKGVVTARTLNTHYWVIGPELRWAGGCWPELVTVTYSHGYATIPQAIREVCLAAASRVYDNPGSLRSQTVGGVSWTAAGEAEDLGPGLTQSEKETLANFQPLVVA